MAFRGLERIPVEEAVAGDIISIAGLTTATVADTIADPSVNARGPSPLDAPNTPAVPDCQASPGGNELQRIGRWAERRVRDSVAWLRRHEIL